MCKSSAAALYDRTCALVPSYIAVGYLVQSDWCKYNENRKNVCDADQTVVFTSTSLVCQISVLQLQVTFQPRNAHDWLTKVSANTLHSLLDALCTAYSLHASGRTKFHSNPTPCHAMPALRTHFTAAAMPPSQTSQNFTQT